MTKRMLRRRTSRLRGRLPTETERAVRSLCAGYHRRKYRTDGVMHPILRSRMTISPRRVNLLIDDALEESCEAGLRETIREDIAERRGVKYTRAVWIGESGYKERKAAAKRAIARRFGLPLE